MRINIKAKPQAHEEKVEKIDESNFIVCVKEPPDKGKANAAIEKVLANYFDIAKSRVHIISGHSSREKIVEIL